MNESIGFIIIWTERALQNSASIKRYLANEFGQREIGNFYTLLRSFEKDISVFPRLYPSAKKHSQFRRAVLSKELSVFYIIKKNEIHVLAVKDNRSNLSKWI